MSIIPPPHESEGLKLVRISEWHRTFRFCAGCIAVVLIAGIIAYAAIEISKETIWATVAKVIGASVVTIVAGQFGLFRLVWRRFKRYTKHNQDRVAQFERERDAARSTSGMLQDGTNPPEDRIT